MRRRSGTFRGGRFGGGGSGDDRRRRGGDLDAVLAGGTLDRFAGPFRLGGDPLAASARDGGSGGRGRSRGGHLRGGRRGLRPDGRRRGRGGLFAGGRDREDRSAAGTLRLLTGQMRTCGRLRPHAQLNAIDMKEVPFGTAARLGIRTRTLSGKPTTSATEETASRGVFFGPAVGAVVSGKSDVGRLRNASSSSAFSAAECRDRDRFLGQVRSRRHPCRPCRPWRASPASAGPSRPGLPSTFRSRSAG